MKRTSWAVVLALTVFGLAWAEGPWFIHLSWQNDPATTMTIMWRTDPGVVESVVEYGLSPELGNQVQGTRHCYVYGRQEVVWHIVELTGLTPQTTYFYRCGASGYWSDVYSFTTAPLPDDPRATFSFAVLADTPGKGGHSVTARLLQMAKDDGADFVIFAGDFTAGGAQAEFDRWFDAASMVLPELPLLSVLGDNDALSRAYFGSFAYPGEEKWYFLDYGPVRFIFLLAISEPYVREQIPWLEEVLSNSGTPWKIAVGHKPAYSSGWYGPTDYIVEHWVPLFEKYGLDIYFNGHEHSYERTWPIREGCLCADGVVYITASGAGSDLRSPGREFWTAASASVFHYVLVQVSPKELTLFTKNLEGNVIDSFRIRNPGKERR